ncbi:flagellar hook capping FlgD N-terminal domain-containing protein [Paenirhodobacter sp.]|uniref:flagellar hook capping FlgD N-terminal domain-containing protein n=1 Tax=Paenirhodobacter sp. TaxID=1965326 RepID=UPI003B3F3D05
MTTVTAATPSTTGAKTNTASSSAATISSDFTTFLKMLTTQMQNQDPTDPIESSDYAAQLANFSQVEQQVKTNDLLGTISGALGLSGLSQYANWVGMEVLSTGGAFYDGVSPVSLFGSANKDADEAILVVSDASGKEVARHAVSPSENSFEWNGTDSSGKPLPLGSYDFALESYGDGSLIDTKRLSSYDRVVEARMENNEMALVLANGARISPRDVTALRETK